MTTRRPSDLQWLGPTIVGGSLLVSYLALILPPVIASPSRSLGLQLAIGVGEFLVLGTVVGLIGAGIRAIVRAAFFNDARPQRYEPDYRTPYYWLVGVLAVYLGLVAFNVGGSYWHGAIATLGGMGVAWSILTVVIVVGYTRVRRRRGFPA